MLKPKDFDQITAYGEFKPLELGGHVCQIMQVDETESRTKKPMLVISLDTAPQDKQPGYYAEQYRADDRPDKKWGCRVFQLVYDNEGKTSKGFKTFVTAVEKSNPGFQVQWGDGFAACFKGKLIGGVFGREEYEKNDGTTAWSTKCVSFRSVETIQSGVEVPKDRPLKRGAASAPAYTPERASTVNDYAIIDDTAEDLPF